MLTPEQRIVRNTLAAWALSARKAYFCVPQKRTLYEDAVKLIDALALRVTQLEGDRAAYREARPEPTGVID